MNPEVVRRHAAPVPRYTSYPTAPHFSDRVQAAEYRSWLEALSPEARISLYFHIPYCTQLCWYCGCNTKETHRYEPVAAYMEPLLKEVAHVAALVPRGHRVSHIHWGGGSPNILSAEDIRRLAAATKAAFNYAPGMEFAVEIDPRTLDPEQVTAWAEAGVNRVSLGVQDFEPAVQDAINRQQSYEMTRDAIELFRSKGIPSVNIDLVYGLPHQTRESVARTIQQVLTLKPDRIAIFGYAHLPSRLKHQRLIDDAALPGAVERYGQSRRLARILLAAGYEQIGLDHFSLPSDHLAGDNLKRNFQGYTTDTAEALIGFGASAISQLPQGYAQNAVATGEYDRRVREKGLATARGIALSDDDRVRAYVIERLMCDFSFSAKDLESRFGAAARPVIDEVDSVVEADRDGFVKRNDDGFVITEAGKPFVRTVCACFDTYLGTKAATHAMAV